MINWRSGPYTAADYIRDLEESAVRWEQEAATASDYYKQDTQADGWYLARLFRELAAHERARLQEEQMDEFEYYCLTCESMFWNSTLTECPYCGSYSTVPYDQTVSALPIDYNDLLDAANAALLPEEQEA